MVKSTMTSGRGGTAAAMAQNEQTTEEHSTLEQQSPRRLDHPAWCVVTKLSSSVRKCCVVLVDRRIRVYDTSHAEFRETRCIQAHDVGWSILDLALRYICLSVSVSLLLHI